MHVAPTVQVAFGPDRTARVLSTALAAIATLDLLSWLLSWVEVDPVVSGRRAWIPLSQATVEAAWGPLRSALYSSRLADVPPPAAPPA
jgi:hypothetical protein